MNMFFNKALAWISITCILFSVSPLVVYGADTLQDLEVVKTKVLQLQADDPSLPANFEQKWRVGTLLSKLFDQDGKIGFFQKLKQLDQVGLVGLQEIISMVGWLEWELTHETLLWEMNQIQLLYLL